jgi:hypothetical protein
MGCQTINLGDEPIHASLLKASRSARDVVTLEIYWANLPVDPVEGDSPVWSHIQEDRLPAELRKRLAQNGLRAGVVGGSLPSEIAEILNPGDQPDSQSAASLGAATESVVRETGVWRRTRQLRPGDHIELKASEVKPQAPLLYVRKGELQGDTLTGVQAFYQLGCSLTEDGRAELHLTPEIRHGAPKTSWTPDETGVISRSAPKKDAEVFLELVISAPLAAGESLLVTSLPDSDSRLGGHLHSAAESSGGRRKAILIRVVQAPRSDALLPADAA